MLLSSKCIALVIFVDVTYSEHEETKMLAVLHMQMCLALNQALTHLSDHFGPIFQELLKFETGKVFLGHTVYGLCKLSVMMFVTCESYHHYLRLAQSSFSAGLHIVVTVESTLFANTFLQCEVFHVRLGHHLLGMIAANNLSPEILEIDTLIATKSSLKHRFKYKYQAKCIS